MITIQIASQLDEAVLRALLRENSLPSTITMTMEREPNYFAGSENFGREWTLLGKDGQKPVGMCTCTEQPVHLNGNQANLGYLSALRINQNYRNRIGILKAGSKALRQLSKERNLSLCYTAISTQNRTAKRVLEARLPGMPSLQYLNDMVTIAMPKERGTPQSLWRRMRPEEAVKVCTFYNHYAVQFQFSPVLTRKIMDISAASFFVVERQGMIIACMALWNQQHYKQVVVRGYSRTIKFTLPLYNSLAWITKKVRLPKIGEILDHSSLAFLAIAPELENKIPALFKDALALCPTDVMTFGAYADHPWIDHLIHELKPVTYRTSIYAVGFEGPINLDGRLAQPEVAVL